MSAPDKTDDKDFAIHDSELEESEFDELQNLSYEIADELNHKFFPWRLIFAVVGFLILIILLIVVISRSQDLAEKKQILAIEERIEQLETVFTSKLDQITKELNRFDQTLASKQASSAKPSSPPEKISSLKEVSSPPEKEKNDLKPKIHKVQVGDSLYQISLDYGLTIEQLCSYNNMEPNAKIYPGQELKLTP